MLKNTLVTAFVDLQKYDHNNRKPSSEYLPKIEELLQYDGPMVIFCETDMSSVLREIRLRHGKGDLTYVIVFNFYNLPFADRIEEMRQMDFFPLGLNKHRKESYEYFVMTWNKIHFLKRALEVNPFESEGFAWIDIGITYVPGILINNVNDTLAELKKIMSSNFEKIRMGCMCETSEEEASNPNLFYSERRSKLISGFISMPKELVNIFDSLISEEIGFCLKNGYFNLEEAIISRILAGNREYFEIYYGDYEDIFRCYFGRMGRVSTLMINIRYCHQYMMKQLWDLSYIIATNTRDNPQMNMDLNMMKEIYGYLEDSSYDDVKCKKLYEFFLDLDVDPKYLPSNSRNLNDLTPEDYLSSLNLEEICDERLDIGNGIISPDDSMMYIPENPEKSERTFVTIYYDLTKIFGRQYSRQSENHESQNKCYLSRADELLKMNHCILFICDSDICNDILEKRKEYGFENKTVIIPFDFVRSPYYKLKPLIKKCLYSSRASHSVGHGNDRFFHITVLPLIYTKMKALEMAHSRNYFGSDIYHMTDFGIFKINNNKHKHDDLEKYVNIISNDKITFPYIFITTPEEISDRESFYRSHRWKTVAGFFSVPGIHTDIFLKTWKEELITNLGLLLPASEEQILSCVCARLDHICDNYQADYQNIIENLTENHTEHHIIMTNLVHCNHYKYYSGFEKLVPSLIKTCSERFDMNGKIKILQQLMIAVNNNEKLEKFRSILNDMM